MKLVIVRHGKAEHDSITGMDRDRKLSALGERQALWLGEALKIDGFGDSMVLSSRAERAIATARLLCRGLGSKPCEVDSLMLGGPVAGLVPLIENFQAEEQLIVVGHNPPMSELASLLVSGAGRCTVQLRTGTAAVVDLPELASPGTGRLIDLLRLND